MQETNVSLKYNYIKTLLVMSKLLHYVKLELANDSGIFFQVLK